MSGAVRLNWWQRVVVQLLLWALDAAVAVCEAGEQACNWLADRLPE